MFLHQCKAAAVARLKALPFFTTAPEIDILQDDREDLISAIEISLSQLGLCVLIAGMEGKVKDNSIPALRFAPLVLVAGIRENVALNRAPGGTRQPADYVAQMVAMALHNHQPDPTNGGVFQVTRVARGDDPPSHAWDVIFEVPAFVAACGAPMERISFPEN